MINKIGNLFYPTIILISISTILSALYIEHILSVPACKLCLYQRIPYIFSIIICFFGFFFSNYKIWIYLLIITFVSSLTVSGYHIGIENSIFPEFSGCRNENLNTTDKAELLKSLKSSLPNCKDVNFKIFGFSLASINSILSIVLSAIFLKIFLNYGKN